MIKSILMNIAAPNIYSCHRLLCQIITVFYLLG